MRNAGIAVFTLFGLLAAACSAEAATIDVGTHFLAPNTAGQTFAIPVSGGDQVQGGDFYFQVADGGPEAGGSIDGPEISVADILGNPSSGPFTIFTLNNTGDAGGGSLAPQFWASGTTTATGTTVSADGTLAFVTVDTSGFLSGSWELKMKDTQMGDSGFGEVPTTVNNGWINIVPEPSALVLLVVLAGFLLVGRRLDSRFGK
jgi:hypothetical protein